MVGGLRLDEPAADLAVALALVSGLKDKPIPEDVVAFGEIGLSGELRSVSRAAARVVEAARLGFRRCVLPVSSAKQLARTAADIPDSVEVIGVRSVREAVAAVLGR